MEQRAGSHWRVAAILAALGWVIFPAHALAADQQARLLYAEPVISSWAPTSSEPGARTSSPPDASLRFHAFGRLFDMRLAANTRLTRSAEGFQALTGDLYGRPGSWARITRRGGDLIGLLYDGQQLFGIEPAAGLAAFLDPGLPAPANGNLIFRLSDLMLPDDALSCGVDAAAGNSTSASAAISALGREFSTQALPASSGPDYRITLAPVADYTFVDRFGANALSEIIAMLNIADGIFRDQVGIDLVADPAVLFASQAAPYPFTASTPQNLLNQLSDYRDDNRVRSGLSHLFTDKTFANQVVGIAWASGACLSDLSAGLSTRAGLTSITHALIVAHEIGHNFGAPHDGESGSDCESVPRTYLMAPRIFNGSDADTFSQCSLDEMGPVIAARAAAYPACLTSIADYDVAISAPSRAEADPGEELDVVLTVENLGNEEAVSIELDFSTPSSLLIMSISADDGFCDIALNSNEATCGMTSLASGNTWSITARVQSTEEGRFSVNATVSAAADGVPANNAANLSVVIGNPPQAATGSGGGGGSFDPLSLLGLLGFGLLASARTSHRKNYRNSQRRV